MRGENGESASSRAFSHQHRNALMDQEDTSEAVRKRHEQMLKLVSRSFYRELANYGVTDPEVLSVAGHLLDSVMHKGGADSKEPADRARLFAVQDVRDEWAAAKRLSVEEVSIVPLAPNLASQIASWLRAPAIREHFHPPFPGSEKGLARYFQAATREYFAIRYRDEPVGLVGAEHVDRQSAKVEMRKLVGDPTMHGKGIGKRATFLFLYYIFVIRKFEKVYVHSMDTNIRNLNLNAKFGFELEGVFLQDIAMHDERRDVVRMALLRPAWMALFSGTRPD